MEIQKKDHPFKNAQWMLDGKRSYWEGTGGFWEGKTRDSHTLQRLSESKYKRVLQYDLNGKFVREWESRKEVATEVFGDYKVVKGGGNTKLYHLLSNKNPKKRLKYGSYWFSREEFNKIPMRICIPIMHYKYKNSLPPPNKTHHSQYTIEYYIKGKLKKTFDNAKHAGHVLGISFDFVRQICNGRRSRKKFDLRYGPKKLQLINMDYGKK